MQFLRVTQGPGKGSHLGSQAVDLGGRDTGVDPVFAPFSGRVIRERQNANGEMYLQSDGPVIWANGTVDYMTVTLIHDSSFDVPAGSHVVQGQHIYDEGGMGSGSPNKFGNHLHLEVSRGKIVPHQVANRFGVYCTPQQVPIVDALALGNDVTVLDGGGLPWRKVTAARTYTVQAGDSWWRIAARQLGSGLKWSKLKAANPGVTVLQPGMTISLEV